MSIAGRGSGEAGFTLVELIVCLGILSLMAALMAAGIAVAQRGGALVQTVEDADTIRAVQVHLRRTFERAEPLFLAGEAGTAKPAFMGAPDRIRFVARSDGRLESGGLVTVEIGVESVEGETTLVMRRHPVPAPGASAMPSKPHVLLRGVNGLSVRYLGRPNSGGPLAWTRDWAVDALPELIALDLSFSDSSNTRWPEMLLPVPLSQRGA